MKLTQMDVKRDLVYRDFEVEELITIGIAELVQVQLSALERMIELRHVVEEKAGAGGVRFDDKGLVLELVEVFLNVFVTGFRLHLDGWERAGDGDLLAFPLGAGHEALDVFGFGGLNAIAAGRVEEDARVAQRDGAVAIVGDDEADGHDAVTEVVNAENGFLLARVVGFDGNGDVFFLMGLDRRERRGWLDWRDLMVIGPDCGGEPNDQKRQRADDLHRARLYHLRVRPPEGEIRLA